MSEGRRGGRKEARGPAAKMEGRRGGEHEDQRTVREQRRTSSVAFSDARRLLEEAGGGTGLGQRGIKSSACVSKERKATQTTN